MHVVHCLCAALLFVALETLFKWLSLPSGLTTALAVAIVLLIALLWFFSSTIKRKIKELLGRPRRKGTRGREFLLLLDKEARREVFNGYAGTNTLLAAFALLLFLALSPIFYFLVGGPTGWTFAGSCLAGSAMMFALLLYKLAPLRKILLPIYHKHRLEAAVSRCEAAEHALKAKLPTEQYRVAAHATDAPRLRVQLQERVLPEELAREAALIVQAADEIADVEQTLAELNSRAAIKASPIT